MLCTYNAEFWQMRIKKGVIGIHLKIYLGDQTCTGTQIVFNYIFALDFIFLSPQIQHIRYESNELHYLQRKKGLKIRTTIYLI